MSLEVKQVNKTFTSTGGFLGKKREPVKAVQEVSFTLREGGSLGVVGESGSGKTTLAKMLAGFLTADSGSAHFNGQDLFQLNRRGRAFLTQMVFQDPFASLNPKLLLRTQLEEGLKMISPEKLFERASALMEDVGLSHQFLDRYPHQLSGGQRQRFAVARALSVEPKILLADEPVSSLDLSVQAQIINLLNHLREKKNLTLLVISHDLAVVGHMCDDILVMKEGRVVESGPASTLLTSPQDPYSQRLLAAAPRL